MLDAIRHFGILDTHRLVATRVGTAADTLCAIGERVSRIYCYALLAEIEETSELVTKEDNGAEMLNGQF